MFDREHKQKNCRGNVQGPQEKSRLRRQTAECAKQRTFGGDQLAECQFLLIVAVTMAIFAATAANVPLGPHIVLLLRCIDEDPIAVNG